MLHENLVNRLLQTRVLLPSFPQTPKLQLLLPEH